jgi:hypothetical protein
MKSLHGLILAALTVFARRGKHDAKMFRAQLVLKK